MTKFYRLLSSIIAMSALVSISYADDVQYLHSYDKAGNPIVLKINITTVGAKKPKVQHKIVKPKKKATKPSAEVGLLSSATSSLPSTTVVNYHEVERAAESNSVVVIPSPVVTIAPILAAAVDTNNSEIKPVAKVDSIVDNKDNEGSDFLGEDDFFGQSQKYRDDRTFLYVGLGATGNANIMSFPTYVLNDDKQQVTLGTIKFVNPSVINGGGGYSLMAGLQINHWWSMDVSYNNFMGIAQSQLVNIDYLSSAIRQQFSYSIKQDLTIYDVSSAFKFALDNAGSFYVLFRAGVAYMMLDNQINTNLAITDATSEFTPGTYKNSGISSVVGLGLSYDVNSYIRFALELRNYGLIPFNLVNSLQSSNALSNVNELFNTASFSMQFKF